MSGGSASVGAGRGRTPKAPGAPHGPDQVRPAIIGAATDLFVEHGVAGVSVKQIAERARVHPSLVRRYVGTKSALVRAVLADQQTQIISQLDSYATDVTLGMPPLSDAVLDRYLRVVTHLVLEGQDIRDYQPDFPIIRHVIDVVQRRNKVTNVEARRRGAHILTLVLAVHLYGPALMTGAGLQPDDAPDLDLLVRQLTVSIAAGRRAL